MGRYYYIGTFEGTENPDVQWPHRHDFYSIVWFTDSRGINVIDFEEYEIKANRLFIMQPGQIHNWSYDKGSKGYILVFDRHFISELPLDLQDVIFIDLPHENSVHIELLLENLIDELNTGDKLSEKIILSGISYLLDQLRRFAEGLRHNESIKPEIVLKFLSLINYTISENLSVKAYADKLNLSTDKLNEICKEHYGKTPKTIILDKKILEAKRLLYFTNLSVKEIAFRLGFEDSSYFSRVFRQKTTLSPTDFKST